MNCDQVKKYCVFHIEGVLDEAMKTGFEAHLHSCASCREIYDKLNAAMSLIPDEKHNMDNPYFINRIEQKLADLNTIPVQKAPVLVRVLKPVLLVLLIMISATIGLFVGGTVSQDELSSASSGTGITEIAGQYQLNMSQEEILENYYTAN